MQQHAGSFLFTTASRPALGTTQPPIQRVPGDLSPGGRVVGYKAYHSSPSSAEVKNTWSYTSTSPQDSLEWCLIKRRIRLPGIILN